MTKRHMIREAVFGAVAINSPTSGIHCLDPSGSVAVEGTCDANTTCLWWKLLDPSEDCATYNENPIQAGAAQIFPDSSGNWSGGSVSPGSPSDYGDRCVVIWCLDEDSNQISMVVRNFTFLDPSNPLCGGSGSGSGGGSAMGTGAAGGFESAAAGHRRGRGHGEPVIKESAPRAYRVYVPAGGLQLAEPLASLLSSAGDSLVGATLEFDPVRSSQRRAVWRSDLRSAAWSLDVRRERGTLSATLTLFRLGRKSVRAPLVWCGAWCFRKQRLQLAGPRGSRLPNLVIEPCG
ncbi:MAG TPA: hypothetical protein VFB80_06425 [Pirellulaceae bacterium]|nr:hypothetical protein [Pirellulaceae bacterium]